MSAIALVLNLDGRPVDPAQFARMLDRMEHRGTDGRGIWTDGFVSLGHRMRWVTPESLYETLPLISPDSPVVMTCDARIDNREDLISELRLKHKSSNEVTDSEIVLKAFEKWGEACPARLIGDYVFAIWDPRSQTLFCARDPLGVRHFYYYWKPGKIFAIASEIKALLELPEVPQELDEYLIGDLLILSRGEKVRTFYKYINRLPATSALRISDGSLKVWEYWHPDYGKELKLRSDADYEDSFRELFEKAVSCRLRSLKPVGASLSGGLDSSSVVGMASNIRQKTGKSGIDTFSVVFPSLVNVDERIDETSFMNSVIDFTNCNPHFIRADEFSPMVDLEKWLWHTDHPIGTPNIYMGWSVCKAASKAGMGVVLTGTDGDTTISHGYEDLYELARRGRLWKLYNEGRALQENSDPLAKSLRSLVWKQGLRPVLEEFNFKARRLLRMKDAVESHDFRSSILKRMPINRHFFDAANLEQRYRVLHDRYYSYEPNRIENHWRSLTSGTYAFILETFEKCSAAFGIEERHPFFDRRLIEFCVSLPPGQKLANGWTRSILRRGMGGLIPEDVRWRKGKSNLSANFRLGSLRFERERIDQTLHNHSNVLEKYFDMKRLSEAVRKFETNPLSNKNAAMAMVVAVQLSGWLRQSGIMNTSHG